MIHVFHGFLGSPEDFSFLKGDGVLIHDLYEMNEYPTINEDDTLIGYSMGGRLALELASRHEFKIKKLVLISAHPGLKSESERSQRKGFESQVMDNLNQMSKEDFMSWWNALKIFEHDSPLREVSDETFRRSPEIFYKYRLSLQDNFLEDIAKNKNKVLYIVGLSDEKYMTLVEEDLLPLDIDIKSIEGGHRLFQKKEELLSLLKTEGIL